MTQSLEKLNKYFLAFLTFTAIATSIFYVIKVYKASLHSQPPKPGLKKAYMGGTLIWVKIAETAEQREQGLSEIQSMDKNQGMLFIFPEKRIYKFWMKEMNFALDFVWIAEGKVVDITENLPAPAANSPDGEIASVQPKQPADMVLEVNAGWGKKHKVKIGDQIKIY